MLEMNMILFFIYYMYLYKKPYISIFMTVHMLLCMSESYHWSCIFGVTSLKMTSLRATSLLYSKLVSLKLIIFKLVTPKIQDQGMTSLLSV